MSDSLSRKKQPLCSGGWVRSIWNLHCDTGAFAVGSNFVMSCDLEDLPCITDIDSENRSLVQSPRTLRRCWSLDFLMASLAVLS